MRNTIANDLMQSIRKIFDGTTDCPFFMEYFLKPPMRLFLPNGSIHGIANGGTIFPDRFCVIAHRRGEGLPIAGLPVSLGGLFSGRLP
ncbi:MAG: hypothetical protein Q4A06_01165 [Cardiobacteriaceae bacterium]|nr:hypothetical protein [Cardiobacteriaceae bacterium]